MSQSKFVIVIGRQYGSGGRELGKRLASRLNVPYYDKELLYEAATRLGFRPDLLEKADEKPPSPFRSLLSASIGSPSWLTTGAMLSETIYQMQSDVIRSLIAEGSCVIVGRTADYIAREEPGLVSIFLHADLKDRVARVMAREHSHKDAAAAQDCILRHDNGRREYYNYFTGRNWGNADNYHLSLSSSVLDMDGVADVIIACMKARGIALSQEG